MNPGDHWAVGGDDSTMPHDFKDDSPGSDWSTCLRCGLRWKQYESNIPCGVRYIDRFEDAGGDDGWRPCLGRDR